MKDLLKTYWRSCWNSWPGSRRCFSPGHRKTVSSSAPPCCEGVGRSAPRSSACPAADGSEPDGLGHESGKLAPQLLPLPGAGWVVDQIAQLVGIGSEVVELVH